MKRIALILAVLLVSCAVPATASKEGVWTEYISEETGISDCQDAAITLQIGRMQDNRLQALLDNKEHPIKSQSVRTVISAQQKGIWEMENEIAMWMTDSCKTT